MNCYVEILAVDRPFEIDVDDNGRTIYSLNLEALAVAPNDGWEEDLITICQDAGVPLVFGGVDGDTFIGAASTLPTDDGPYTVFVSQPGFGNEETHDGSKYERPSAQVLVRAKPSSVAQDRAFAVWRALDGVRNRTVA